MSETNTQHLGTEIDVISEQRFEDRPKNEKLRIIIDSVKDGKIVVLQGGLSPEEENSLIEKTMQEIEPDSFSGIEIESNYEPNEKESGFIGGLLGSNEPNREPSITIVGPSDMVETIQKEDDIISALVN